MRALSLLSTCTSALLGALLLCAPARAQLVPGTAFQFPLTSGHCLQAASATQAKDAGAPCVLSGGAGSFTTVTAVSGLFTGTNPYVDPNATFGVAANNYSQINVLAGGASVGAFLGTDNLSTYFGSLTGLPIQLQTENNSTQFQINHVASANHFIEVSGSNGAAPSLTTNAGNLSIGSAGGTTTLSDAAAVFSGLITPASTIGIKGTATNDNAQAGSVGQIIEADCPVATSGTIVAFTSASPTVGTWSGSPWSGTGTYACPMNITATAPTGLSTATNYWIVPINATTFHVATSAANALAGTFANTSGSTSASNLTTTALLTTATAANLGAVSLTAGDWECFDYTYYVPTATTSVTNLAQGVTGTSATLGALGTYTDFETAANVMTVTNNPVHAVPSVRQLLSATSNVYSISISTFTASTLAASSDLRCRRVR